jgi:putative transposase
MGCLNERWFTSLADARHTVEAWRRNDNAVRPRSGLGSRTPSEARLVRKTTLPTPAGLSHCVNRKTGAG